MDTNSIDYFYLKYLLRKVDLVMIEKFSILYIKLVRRVGKSGKIISTGETIGMKTLSIINRIFYSLISIDSPLRDVPSK